MKLKLGRFTSCSSSDAKKCKNKQRKRAFSFPFFWTSFKLYLFCCSRCPRWHIKSSDLLINDEPSEMLIGGRVKIPELSCFFLFFFVYLPIFKTIFWLFCQSKLIAQFFPPNVLLLSKYFNTILVYVVDKKIFCEVRNSKELFTSSSPCEPRIRQCWFYFFRFAFLHAFLGFDENKFGRPMLLCFFSWGCKVLINCPAQKAKFRGGILSSSRIYMRKYLYPYFWKPD